MLRAAATAFAALAVATAACTDDGNGDGAASTTPVWERVDVDATLDPDAFRQSEPQRPDYTLTWTGEEVLRFGNGTMAWWSQEDGWREQGWTTHVAARSDHSAIWTGEEIFVYGAAETDMSPVIAYSPVHQRSRSIPPPPAPLGRGPSVLGWHSGEVFVWEGQLGLGAAYSTYSSTWRPLPTGPPPGDHEGAWTGGEFVIWGTAPSSGAWSVAVWDQSSNQWHLAEGPPVPTAPSVGAYSGERVVLVVGGDSVTSWTFDLETRSWTAAPSPPAAVGADLVASTLVPVAGDVLLRTPAGAALFDVAERQWVDVGDVPRAAPGGREGIAVGSTVLVAEAESGVVESLKLPQPDPPDADVLMRGGDGLTVLDTGDGTLRPPTARERRDAGAAPPDTDDWYIAAEIGRTRWFARREPSRSGGLGYHPPQEPVVLRRGSPDGPRLVLPRGHDIVSGSSEGLVLARAGTDPMSFAGPTLVLWDPERGREVRELTDNGHFIASVDDFLVWDAWECPDGSCPAHVLDLRSGEERTYPVETDGPVAVSPDRTRLARGHTVVDLDIGATFVIPPIGRGEIHVPGMVWLTDDWLLLGPFGMPSGGQQIDARLAVWRVGEPRADWWGPLTSAELLGRL